MRRACLRFGVVCCAMMVACWRGGGAGQTTVANHQSAAAPDALSGGYWCSIQTDGYRYGNFPCAIRNMNGHYVLAKLGGSQRFTGEIVPSGNGFSFDGKFYCPYGDCTQPMHGAFERRPDGAYQGRFDDAHVVVQLVRAPDNAFGGAGYGGDEYGGFSYGGASYGNALERPNFRRNQKP